jgi:hypothetical protein
MSRPNFILDAAGNISALNVGNTGVSQQLVYSTLIIAGISLLVIGFIPGANDIYNLINSRITLLSIILLVVSTYISTATAEKSNALSTVGQSFQIADRCKSSFIGMISGNGNSCPQLINSFYFPFQKDPSTNYKSLPLLAGGDNYTAVNAMCTMLYQNVEDFVNTLNYTFLANAELLTHYATLFVSPIVQEHWSINDSGYQYCTVLLINDLIHIVNHYTFKSEKELETFFIIYGGSTKFWSILDNTFIQS